MKKKVLIIVVIIVIVFIIGLITSFKDSARVRNNIEPKYSIKIVNKDGTKITYWGIGYKVIRYVNVSPIEPFQSNKGVKYGGWFMTFEIDENK